ncbi:MAG: PH domain-containing protein [Planctomycetes bacterium]|nr:PH domain-containing protein [Planctomycetota bacterium]MBI3835423.1 PH domain-containing protein [Planctomycetota bacterium]
MIGSPPVQSSSMPQDPAAAMLQPQPQPPVGPEQELWTGRTSFRHFAGSISVWLIVNIAILIGVVYLIRGSGKLSWTADLSIVLVALLVTSILILSRAFGMILGRRYRLTSQRLFIERGLLGTTTDQMELTRVEDIRVQKSFMDRVFGVGTVDLLTTDVTDHGVVLAGIANPDIVAELIRARMRNLRGRSVFVENLNP